MLSFEDAREKVIAVAGALAHAPAIETVKLDDALGRVLAEGIIADRDYPPFDRSTRDGYAVRAEEAFAGDVLTLIGEIHAGQSFDKEVLAGECVQIMTGAAVPVGADAVVMIEHTRTVQKCGVTTVAFERNAVPGQNVVLRGIEAKSGRRLLAAGSRLGFAELAICGQVGHTTLRVTRRPRVAILSTGDEVVGVDVEPGPLQIRNGNSVSLAAQVRLAGCDPVLLGNARDEKAVLRSLIEQGLQCDALVTSGGVSAGKYDLVEDVLKELGAEIQFERVEIRPGRPAVFATCKGKPVFGLPGNPVSTMVTFELFVLPALDILSGAAARKLPVVYAKLGAAVKQTAALTHFLPAQISWETGEPVVRELPWQGSGDIVALAHANCFIVVPANKLEWAAGESIGVLIRRGAV
jgi:molybdopterin molybdotransferase